MKTQINIQMNNKTEVINIQVELKCIKRNGKKIFLLTRGSGFDFRLLPTIVCFNFELICKSQQYLVSK